MDIEKIEALPLTKAQAMGYAKSVVGEQMGNLPKKSDIWAAVRSGALSSSAAKTGKRSP